MTRGTPLAHHQTQPGDFQKGLPSSQRRLSTEEQNRIDEIDRILSLQEKGHKSQHSNPEVDSLMKERSAIMEATHQKKKTTGGNSKKLPNNRTSMQNLDRVLNN
ncbi:hypothetical protein GNI_074320 [Gregarina niphandrodes]|uniref:Uncharacterized protein n=1 Tax=Gregarina niphandrodes TaxID=110365 RepID=A0A023B704_GRENI|nr:hypothetical protein GNI_074320 [Gregarina niphandrodes]EZG66906.1 hypothetical protein GNI_074320 [Gregarina niphandrodes]|eukprot:XP_011130439.1 hypothetical protein GNI_074320 [Gregarina niphandrodes]